MSGGAALLAALAPGARLLLLLALAAVERLRQDAPGRPQPVELGLQRLDARGQRRVLRRQIPNLGAQPAILLPQRRDQPRGPHDRRPEPIVALAQPRDRALPGCHQPLGRREPLVELLAQRLGHAGALAGHLHNFRAASIEVLLQPVDLVLAPRLDPLPVLVSPVQRNAKIGHLVVQEPEPALQRLRGPRPDLRCGRHRAGGILRLSNSRLELEPAGVELSLQRTRARTGIPLRPAQLLAAQVRHVRPGPFLLDARLCLLKQGFPVERLVRRHHEGKRTQGVAALGRRQVGAEILVENRHAQDGSACVK